MALDPLNRYDVDEIEQVFRGVQQRAHEVMVLMRGRGDTEGAQILANNIAAVKEKHSEIVAKLRLLLK